MARVTPPERASAPRLINWTGERCVPWADDVQVVYEHLHRYHWAAQLVHGRTVLDLACGEGFGAAILAGTADRVLGVDLDPVTVEHAQLNYSQDRLAFQTADARDLSALPAGSFGAVVAFEMIEHVSEQELVLEQIAQVLEPGGLLIISTPDRDAYARRGAAQNEFHVRELSRAEFESLLQTSFANLALFGQRAITGSSIIGIAGTGGEPRGWSDVFVEREGESWRTVPSFSPLYMIAIASNAPLPAVPDRSALGDTGLALVRSAEAAAGQARAEAREAIARARMEQEEAENQAQNLVREIRQQADARAARDAETISLLDAQLNAAAQRIRRIEQSVTWQLFQSTRERLFGALGGEESAGVRGVQSSLRYVGRHLGQRAKVPAANGEAPPQRRRSEGPIELRGSEQPTVSIVIPLHAHAELTRAALDSIRANTHLPYEVILIDDAADADTKALLRQVHGARVISNEQNLGYLRSINLGCAQARGTWLVLCNNDIEVQAGWLAALLECGTSSSRTAIVAPKYVYPDGTLAEAGGIIWSDGSGANYGRGEPPSNCQFEYRRVVDYGSAAALLVRRDFWVEVGGFDERYMPMYYEDTDLCFEARARGLDVVYEPGAVVIHHEGATAGTELSSGHKRHQEANRPKFVEKWRGMLETEHLANEPGNVWLAATLRAAPRVFVIDHRMPMWDRESGGLRMRGMLTSLLELGCHVTFLPDNQLAMQPYTRELQRAGVEVLYGIEVPEDVVAVVEGAAMVILSRPHVAAHWLDLVRESSTEAFVVYDTVDLHWLREARRATVARGPDADELVMTPKTLAMRELEIGLIHACDATVVVTDNERDQVLADVPDAEVHVLSNVNRVSTAVPGPSTRSGVVFVGGFEHPPNLDAAVALVRDIMPLVWRELPDVTVTIAGSEPPPEVTGLAGPRVRVTGWVPDLNPLLERSRAMVAPLTYGAGLKGKVTQALAAGLPVVTTPVGAEGLDARDGIELLIAADPAELAERMIRVVCDDGLWRRLSTAGQELVARKCSPELMTERMGALLHAATATAVASTASRAPAYRLSSRPGPHTA